MILRTDGGAYAIDARSLELSSDSGRISHTNSDVVGIAIAHVVVMGVNCVEELIAFQLAQEFKLEVYRLMDGCPAASRDYKFKGQLSDAASGIERCVGEGFRRKRAAEFSTFLRYALASLDEAIIALKDGVHRKYFTLSQIAPALRLARRCEKALQGLHAAQERLRELDRSRPRRPSNPSPRRRPRQPKPRVNREPTRPPKPGTDE